MECWLRLQLRAHFDDGSTADVTCHVGSRLFGTSLAFSVGEIVPVRFDPADRTKIAVDENAIAARDKALEDAYHKQQIQRAEDSLDADRMSHVAEEEDAARKAAGIEAQRRYKQAVASHAVDTSVAWGCPVCGGHNHAGARRCTDCRREF